MRTGAVCETALGCPRPTTAAWPPASTRGLTVCWPGEILPQALTDGTLRRLYSNGPVAERFEGTAATRARSVCEEQWPRLVATLGFLVRDVATAEDLAHTSRRPPRSDGASTPRSASTDAASSIPAHIAGFVVAIETARRVADLSARYVAIVAHHDHRRHHERRTRRHSRRATPRRCDDATASLYRRLPDRH